MIAQAIVDGLIAGAMIGLGAIGITLTYSILRFANFAHGEFISWGAYAALGVGGALATASRRSPCPSAPSPSAGRCRWALLAVHGADRASRAARRCAAVRQAARRARRRHHPRHGGLRRGADAAQPARIPLHLEARLFHRRAADRHEDRRSAPGPRRTSCCRSPCRPCSSSRCTCCSPAPPSAAPCAR